MIYVFYRIDVGDTIESYLTVLDEHASSKIQMVHIDLIYDPSLAVE